MTVTVKDICEEVKTLIDGFHHSDFTSIEVVNVPRLDEDSLSDTRCYIVGQSRASANVSRGLRQYTFTILVFVVGRVAGPNDQTAFDLQELALEVSQKLERAVLPVSKATETATEITLYDADQIQSQNVSQSLITVTFDGVVRSA